VSLRFRRSIRVLPGVRLNLGLHGAGLSVGPRGLHVGVNRRGMYTSAGIPGTGLYAIHHIHTGAGEHRVRGGSGCAPALIVVLVAAVILLSMWIVVLLIER
jgi:Protein of unknown function (DUF4236)